MQVRAPQEHLHAYLRSLDVEGEGLPASFLAALRRALDHYGVDDLERTPALEEALYWIHQSQQRVSDPDPGGRRHPRALAGAGSAGRRSSTTLGAAPWTAWSRPPSAATRSSPIWPVRSASASSTSHGCGPSATPSYAEMDGHLAALVADPGGPERDAHMAELVDCPQPLAPLLLRRLAVDPPATRPIALETMTRRYYRRRDPRDVRSAHRSKGATWSSRPCDGADGGPMHVVTTAAPPAELAAAARTLAAAGTRLPAGEPVSFDIYTWEDDGEPTALAAADAWPRPSRPRSPPTRSGWSWASAARVRPITSARCAT